MAEGYVLRCEVCGAQDSYVVGLKIDGKSIPFPSHFVFAWRGKDEPHGICNLCFAARRFPGFTSDEIEYFREQFSNQEEFPED
jgi:hypothetical protein